MVVQVVAVWSYQEIYQPRVLPKGELSDQMFEDMTNFLRVIKDGHKVLRYGRYLMNTRVHSTMEGGLKEFYANRTPEQYKAVVEIVKKEFPWLPWRIKDTTGQIEPDLDCPAVGGKKL